MEAAQRCTDSYGANCQAFAGAQDWQLDAAVKSVACNSLSLRGFVTGVCGCVCVCVRIAFVSLCVYVCVCVCVFCRVGACVFSRVPCPTLPFRWPCVSEFEVKAYDEICPESWVLGAVLVLKAARVPFTVQFSLPGYGQVCHAPLSYTGPCPRKVSVNF